MTDKEKNENAFGKSMNPLFPTPCPFVRYLQKMSFGWSKRGVRINIQAIEE